MPIHNRKIGSRQPIANRDLDKPSKAKSATTPKYKSISQVLKAVAAGEIKPKEADKLIKKLTPMRSPGVGGGCQY